MSARVTAARGMLLALTPFIAIVGSGPSRGAAPQPAARRPASGTANMRFDALDTAAVAFAIA
jgi:hypothetical protein